MLTVTREADHRCRLRPSQRAVVALMYLLAHTALAKIAECSGVSDGEHDHSGKADGTE